MNAVLFFMLGAAVVWLGTNVVTGRRGDQATQWVRAEQERRATLPFVEVSEQTTRRVTVSEGLDPVEAWSTVYDRQAADRHRQLRRRQERAALGSAEQVTPAFHDPGRRRHASPLDHDGDWS